MFKSTKSRITLAGSAISAMVLLAACGGTSASNTATGSEQSVENGQLQIYNTNQPLPVFPDSQLRQTLIDIQTAQAEGAPSTTFMMPNNWATGVRPWYECPSIGFPVSSTDQLSNPDQIVHDSNGNDGVALATIPQIDPNGIFSGDSTGTYTLCLNEAGQKYGAYWEGYTLTLTGNAAWNQSNGTISDVTNPTGSFNTLTPAQQKAVNNAAVSAFENQNKNGGTNTTPTTTKK